MSLFDVIKYQNTNLSNSSELFQLPEDLLNKFWIESHKATRIRIPRGDDYFSHKDKCDIFSGWAYKNKHKIFNKVLKKYNP